MAELTTLERLSAQLKQTVNDIVLCDASHHDRQFVLHDAIDYMERRAEQCWESDPDQDLI